MFQESVITLESDIKFAAEAVRLSECRPGMRGTVSRVEASSPMLKHKLLSMGIVQGTEIAVTHIAPLGDPMTIRALGYSLSLRKSEALGVFVVLRV